MAAGVHFGGKVAIGFVLHVAVFGEESHCFDREGKHGFGTLLVEPRHEAALQPVDGGPLRLRTVGKAKVAENALKVITVVIGYVPENRLEIAGAGGLVDGIDNLLETVGNHLVEGAVTG